MLVEALFVALHSAHQIQYQMDFGLPNPIPHACTVSLYCWQATRPLFHLVCFLLFEFCQELLLH